MLIYTMLLHFNTKPHRELNTQNLFNEGKKHQTLRLTSHFKRHHTVADILFSFLTFSSALFRSFSFSGGVRSRRTSQASFSRGMTLRKISVAMKSEQMGSAINQPNWRMRMVEMMTPTLPNVSASTWRNTPVRKQV